MAYNYLQFLLAGITFFQNCKNAEEPQFLKTAKKKMKKLKFHLLSLLSFIMVIFLSYMMTNVISTNTNNENNNDGTIETLPAIGNCNSKEQVEGMNTKLPNNNEWRELTPDETVPQGSHVRLDMTTGERFVKIEGTIGSRLLATLEPLIEMDEELGKRIQAIKDSGVPGSEQYENGVKTLWNERQQVLKGTKKNNDSSTNTQSNNSNNTSPDLLNNHNAEHVALPFLVEAVKSHPSLELRIKALTEIEFRVQSIDDAEIFTKMGGMQVCIEALTDVNPIIRSLAAHVLGSAVKSTNHLQQELLSKNGLMPLLDLLHHNETEVKALYAIGALLRGNEKACTQAMSLPEFASLLIARLRSPQPIADKATSLIGDLLHDSNNIPGLRQVFLQARLCAHIEWMSEQHPSVQSKHLTYLKEALREGDC
jgi:hypothetical protein